MPEPKEGNPNIQVEITDPSELHCFRLVLNPKGHAPDCPEGLVPGSGCSCPWPGGTGVRLEVMFHARSLVDLIHKASLALCEWQKTNTDYLLDKMGVPHPRPLR